jgi:hypothetical protein
MSANRTGDPFEVIRITRMLCRRLKPFNVRVFRELEAFYFRFALDGEGSCAGGSLTKCRLGCVRPSHLHPLALIHRPLLQLFQVNSRKLRATIKC